MVRLRVDHQQAHFGTILAHFLHYYLVLGSRSDFHGNESQGAFRCRSSTLAVWPILARFLDYYSVFWSKRDFHGAFTCRSMTLTILANFWSVLCTITHRFGVPERFP